MAPADPIEQDDRDYVNSLARGLSVIRAFDREHAQMTLSEVADRSSLNRAAARRFLLTLVREGYVETDGKWFRLRPKIFELGFSALSSMSFVDVAAPVMDDVSARLDETCVAAVLDDQDVVYVAKSTSQRVVNVNLEIGGRLPASCMSTGRVLLAGLPDDQLEAWLARWRPTRYTARTITSKPKLRAAILEARTAGWAIVDEEYEEGFRSVSVPIKDRLGTTLAGLNIPCPSPRVSLETMRTRFLPELQEAAQRISSLLPEALVRRGTDALRNGAASRRS